MSPSAVRLLCPNLKCRTILSVPISARGKTVRCRSCGMRVVVPVGAKPKTPSTPAADADPVDTPAA
jgi:DNA-directed RNA polymerase subunit RPC12/RpoP